MNTVDIFGPMEGVETGIELPKHVFLSPDERKQLEKKSKVKVNNQGRYGNSPSNKLFNSNDVPTIPKQKDTITKYKGKMTLDKFEDLGFENMLRIPKNDNLEKNRTKIREVVDKNAKLLGKKFDIYDSYSDSDSDYEQAYGRQMQRNHLLRENRDKIMNNPPAGYKKMVGGSKTRKKSRIFRKKLRKNKISRKYIMLKQCGGGKAKMGSKSKPYSSKRKAMKSRRRVCYYKKKGRTLKMKKKKGKSRKKSRRRRRR